MVSWLAGTVWSPQVGEYGKRSDEEGEAFMSTPQVATTKRLHHTEAITGIQPTKRQGGNEKLNF